MNDSGQIMSFLSDGTLFRGRPQKNEALTLCVGSDMRAIPFLNILGFGR